MRGRDNSQLWRYSVPYIVTFMGDEKPISGWGRCAIGAIGGVAAVATKYLGQDHAYFLRLLDLEQYIKINNLWLGYYIMTPLLMFLGAVVAWAVDENNRLKLLAIAVAAPALITTWAGGATSSSKFAFELIGIAHAQPSPTNNVSVSVGESLKLWFGIGRDDQKYRVVAGSFKSPEEASILASKINAESPGLNAYVGQRAPGNPYYAVVVSGYLPYSEAKIVQEKVMKLNAVPDAYLSPFAGR